MAARLVIAPEAEQDLSEAYGWYEKRRLGLCLDACIHTAKKFFSETECRKCIQSFIRIIGARWSGDFLMQSSTNMRTIL